MKPKGKDLSLQARRALNSAVLDWLRDNLHNINGNHLISEVFSPLKSKDLVLLRESLRQHLSHFRVYDKHLPKECRIEYESTTLDALASTWKSLSYPMVGAAMGQCHSTGIKARNKVTDG